MTTTWRGGRSRCCKGEETHLAQVRLHRVGRVTQQRHATLAPLQNWWPVENVAPQHVVLWCCSNEISHAVGPVAKDIQQALLLLPFYISAACMASNSSMSVGNQSCVDFAERNFWPNYTLCRPKQHLNRQRPPHYLTSSKQSRCIQNFGKQLQASKLYVKGTEKAQ